MFDETFHRCVIRALDCGLIPVAVLRLLSWFLHSLKGHGHSTINPTYYWSLTDG